MKEAIEEIIVVQEDKAEFKNIAITLEIIGFGLNYKLWTDRYRL